MVRMSKRMGDCDRLYCQWTGPLSTLTRLYILYFSCFYFDVPRPPEGIAEGGCSAFFYLFTVAAPTYYSTTAD